MIAVPSMLLAHIDHHVDINIWVHTYALFIIAAVVAFCTCLEDDPEDCVYYCNGHDGVIKLPPYCHECKQHYVRI